MKLSKLLQCLDISSVIIEDIDISSVAYNSKNVLKNGMFVCVSGFNVDGHDYVFDAINNGAVAIISEKELHNIPTGIVVIKVHNSRIALARVSANFYGNPSNDMSVIGVTGTNGKTSTVYLLESILKESCKKVGVIGTIQNKIGDKVFHAERTTPESLELQCLLADMRDEKVDDVVMEVSSHSLSLNRVDFIKFDIGIFTNLTQDHLDFHKTMDEYLNAKSILFKKCKHGIINVDDPSSHFILNNAYCNLTTFAIDNTADFNAQDIIITENGVSFNVLINDTLEHFTLSTPGKFAVYNALAAITCSLTLGIDIESIKDGLKNNQGIPGRFQTIMSSFGFSAIVDYAHTPDGLANVLKTAREFVKGSLITVFGCGGDRDKSKRPVMGELAGSLSDYCIITSDNPRTENPTNILDDIEVGMLKTKCPYIKIKDRREAIRYAVKIADKGDIILVAGKGHEDYQIFKDKTIHFDDVEEVKLAMI